MTSTRTISGPDPVDVSHRTVWGWLSNRGERFGDEPAVAVHDGSEWTTRSWRQFVDDARAVATGLIAAGLDAGDRVVVMAPTSYDWTRVDLGIIAAGGVTVPVYDSTTSDQCEAILRQSRPRFAVTADATQSARLREIDPELTIWELERGAVTTLKGGGDTAAAEEFDRRLESIHADTIATIVFTSGTTGTPKGVPLTNYQVVWTACQTAHHLRDAFGPDESTLLFLPLAHIFARVVVFAALEAGVELAYGRSLDKVPEDLRTYRPTFLLSVPRMLERVISGARRQAKGWRRPVFEWGIRSARKWSDAHHRRGPLLRIRHAVADRLVLAHLRAGLGGRVRYAVSGGARLDPALAHTVAGAGIPVLEGYGLTETTAPVTVNTPASNRIGTVGTPLPGISVRLGDDDEIQVQALSVMTGYLHDQDAETDEEEVFDDGWLRTGDQGSITDEGHLVVVTRIKEILVTDGGKNIAPTPLEDKLTDDPAITHAMVIGDSRPFAAALIAVDEDEAPADADERHTHVQRVVDEVNEAVPTSESIRKFRIISRPFTEDDNELTPTMKLRRDQILEHFADDVEALYSGRS